MTHIKIIQAETQEIREKLFTILEEKRRKLKEDKDNCDLAYGKTRIYTLTRTHAHTQHSKAIFLSLLRCSFRIPVKITQT